jgi:hypothetical protein
VKVEILAAEIVNSTAGLVDLGRARCIAGAELEVQRVRATTEATIAQIFAVVTTMIKGLHSRSAKTQRRHCRRWRRGPSNWPSIQRALPIVRMLDRYERRAIARRDKVITTCLESKRLDGTQIGRTNPI